jgi:hypothetical protein
MPDLSRRQFYDSLSDDESDYEDSLSHDDSDTSMPGLLDPHCYSSNHENQDDSDDDNNPQDGDANVPHALGTTCRHNVVYESLRQASSMLHGIDDTDVASACRQVAYLAATVPDDVDTAMNTILLPDETLLDHPHCTLLRDWLIDSGASSHMTNDEADLVLNREESNAIVQVANGALIRAELRGTVRVRIQDLNNPHISCDMLIHDVLYVPGLSRRLLSVDQWNAAGGEIWFHPEHTTLRAVDSDTGESHSFSVAKPFTLLRNIDGLPSASSQKASNSRAQREAHATTIEAHPAVVTKRATSSDLLRINAFV